jgi:hypothetical protein
MLSAIVINIIIKHNYWLYGVRYVSLLTLRGEARDINARNLHFEIINAHYSFDIVVRVIVIMTQA